MPPETLNKLWPLSLSYEYVAELGLSWRMDHRSDWERFCLECDIDKLPALQAQGYAFWCWLEENRDELLKAAIPLLLTDAPEYMRVELQASLECYGRDYSERGAGPMPPRLGGSDVIVLSAEQRAASAIDDWTTEALAGANVQGIPGRLATEHEMRYAHSPHYLDGLRRQAVSGEALLTPETRVSHESWGHCLAGAGALLSAVDLAIEEKPNAPVLCLVRPGSHHASRSRGGGTCLLNNLAIAAGAAIRQRSIYQVGILDIDAHHGNGTEQIFYEDNRVHTASIHQQPPFFPGTGARQDSGKGRGRGANLNIPLAPDGDWRAAALAAVEWLALKPKPQLLLVEFSTDAHVSDPASDLRATDQDYEAIGYRLGRLSMPVIVELGASLSKRAWIGGLRAFLAGFTNGRDL